MWPGQPPMTHAAYRQQVLMRENAYERKVTQIVSYIVFALSLPVLASVIAVGMNAETTFEVTLDPEFNLEGSGSNVDSIAFWEAPDPADSLMFVTVKGAPLVQVWAYPFNESDVRPDLTHDCIDEGSNGVVVDQESDTLYIAVRDSANLCVFSLPDLDLIGLFQSESAYSGEPNLGLLKMESGLLRLYVSDDFVVYIHDASSGEQIDHFEPLLELETLVGDDYNQVLYIPDENERNGVYTYSPDGKPLGRPFGADVFEDDAEGIIIYRCRPDEDDGRGFIVVADQRDPLTDFEFFDRNSKAYLGQIHLTGVNNTDGVASTQQSSPRFPSGLLAVIDDDSTTSGVGWDQILAATGLACE
jgi:myo-inositol-hexaphosphate 3-phosphohydrolase